MYKLLKNCFKLSARLLTMFLIVITLSGCMRGCTAVELPEQLSKEERTLILSVKNLGNVGIKRNAPKVYTDRLIRSLNKTRLFNEVGYLDTFSDPPEYYMSINRRIHGSTAIPILTLISFGFIPTTVTEERGQSIIINNPLNQSEPIYLEFSYRSKTIIGWKAFELQNSSDWTSNDYRYSARYINNFSLALIKAMVNRRFQSAGTSCAKQALCI